MSNLHKFLSTKKLIVFSSLLIIPLAFLVVSFFHKPEPVFSLPKTVNVDVKQFQNSYGRVKISSNSGGELVVNDVSVDFPAGFTDEVVTTSYRVVDSPKLQAGDQVGTMFELKARTEAGDQVTNFDKDLEIKVNITEADLAEISDPEDLGLYFFNEETQQWEEVESSYDEESGKLIALVDHFTIFIVSDGDPNSVPVSVAGVDPFIIDNGDPTGYEPDGAGDIIQPAFWGYLGYGYNGGAAYTHNSIDTTQRNWATWSIASGLTGDVEVVAIIPALTPDLPSLTTRATYEVVHAGGTTYVDIDQSAYAGGSVSLGIFTFAGSGSVKLSDVVAESGDTELSTIVFDAISFGGTLDPNLDITGPTIENVKAVTNSNGVFVIEATITDIGSGVNFAFVYFNGQQYLMQNVGDVYSASLPYSANEVLQYYIYAEDFAENSSVWDNLRGYVIRGSYSSNLGYTPWNQSCPADIRSNAKSSCGAPDAYSQNAGDPVNTLNGNLIEQQKLVIIPGRPEIDFYLTYNSQGGRESIFGENRTHSYNYHLVEMDNLDFQGVIVQYPTGNVVTFTGSGPYTAEPGYFETLEKVGSDFVLTMTDTSQLYFSTDGDLTRVEDANDNGINFSYGDVLPYTLLSKLETITADGGRSLSLTYNGEGLVETVVAPESKTLQFEYNPEHDLITLIDAKGGSTRFEYNVDTHLMTSKISPEGHAYFENTYDAEGRVVFQSISKDSEDYTQDFTYNPDQTIVTDANGYALTYNYNADKLLTSLVDDKGLAMTYTYTADKKTESLTDRDDNTTEFEYDDNGNTIFTSDAEGFETTRTFDSTFNKPLTEVYKEVDHTTSWEYDAKGNLLTIINADSEDQHFTYNGFGQLIETKDYNDNPTSFSYTPEGDIETIIDAELNTKSFTYDGLGRMIASTNGRSNTTNFTFDLNDNLLRVDTPLGYTEEYTYDLNNRKIAEKDANGNDVFFTYDIAENLIKIARPDAIDTEFTYGLMNELLAETDPEGRVTEYTYDNVYDVIATTVAVGTPEEATSEFAYSGMHNLLEATDPEGRITSYEYDSLHRKIKEIRNNTGLIADEETQVTTEYEYSPTGVLTQIIDPLNNPTVYTYDALDRLIQAEDAEAQVNQYAYDAQGNLITETNPELHATTFEYDGLNRLEKSINAKAGEWAYDYDENSNLINQTDPNLVATAYQYDALDRKIKQISNFKSGQGEDDSTNVTTEYSYDLYGNLVTITNPRDFATNFGYDANHRNITIADANSNTTYTEYDKVSNILSITDRNSHTQTYTYDARDRVVQKQNPELHTEEYSYDGVNNLLTYINPRSKTFEKTYDPLNRVKVATDPYLNTKEYEYDAVGNLLVSTDENGHTSQFTYDNVYRLKIQADAEDNTSEITYDKNGNIIAQMDAEGNTTEFVYDELNRLITKINAELEEEHYTYDGLNNIVQEQEADTTAHAYEYDGLYRLVQVVNNFKSGDPTTNDTNVRSEYVYDANNNLTVQVNALGNATQFTFDELDRLEQEIDPLANTWTHSYDNEGNLIARVDANGDQTDYRYYPDDVLQTITYPSHSVNYSYSETNLPTQMVDNLGETTWEYDDLDRLIVQNDPYEKGLQYTYDPVGNLTNLQYPDGRSVTNGYLRNNWLVDTQSSDQDNVSVVRNKVGSPVSITRSNNTTTEYTYDKVYRPLNIHDQQGADLIAEYSYEYNPVGHLNQQVAEYGWQQPSKVTTDYEYDGLHRLALSADTDNNHSQYEYDAVGNRLVQIEKEGNSANKILTSTYNYNSANQLEGMVVSSVKKPELDVYTYQYDNNGNRIDKNVAGNGVDRATEYRYDYENRLARALDYKDTGKESTTTTITTESEATDSAMLEANASTVPEHRYKPRTINEYDGNGRRLSQTYYSGAGQTGKTTEYVFDRLDPIAEYDQLNSQYRNLYRDANQKLVFQQEFKSDKSPNGTSAFFHHDGKGNVSAVSKHDGQAEKNYRYDEYGSIMGEGSANQSHNDYALTGKQYDANTDLYYFGARHYDPMTGTWMSQDTYRGGVRDPRSLHRYGYNSSSPVNYIDAYGYCSNPDNIASGCPSRPGWSISDSVWENDYLRWGLAGPVAVGDTMTGLGDLMAYPFISIMEDTDIYVKRFEAKSNNEPFSPELTSHEKIELAVQEHYEDGVWETTKRDVSNIYENEKEALTNDPIYYTINRGTHLGIICASSFAGKGKALTVKQKIKFSTGSNKLIHGARHLEGMGLSQTEVELRIASQIRSIQRSSTSTGQFWGKIEVSGKIIEYRAYTLQDGTITVGTYYSK